MSYISFFKDRFIPTDEINLNFRDNFLSIVRGYQVFTFFKTIDEGKPLFLDHHIKRLLKNTETMGMKIEQSYDDIEQLVFDTIAENNSSTGEFSIMIAFLGGKPVIGSDLYSNSPMDILVLVNPIRIYPAEFYSKGITVGLFEFQRHYAEIKAPFTYIGGLLAQNAIIKNGDYDEVLYVSNGNILEGTTFSFFAINNSEVVLTAPADGNILRSVTRSALLNVIKKEEMKFEERDLPIDEMYSCKEAFIVSSTRDIIPVVSVDNHTIGDGLVGESTKKLMELYQKEILELVSNRNNV